MLVFFLLQWTSHTIQIILKFSYDLTFDRLPYDVFAGGVTSFTSEQFKTINGFSNQFFGWGGEDDDLYSRYEVTVYIYSMKTIFQYMFLWHTKKIIYKI